MGGTIASQRASYYGADDRLVAADARTPGKQLVEAVRYDALGRRVWVSTRWRCAPSADVACIANAVTRTLWDGASEVAEIRARYDTSAAAMEEMDAGADTVPKSIVGDANPFYGRVVYGPALALDQPLSVTRYEYRDNPYGADALAWPTFTLVPFWDYRGTPVFGLFSDGAYARPYAAGGSSCPGSPGTGTTDRCVYLTWPFAGSAYHQDRGLTLTYSWQGSLMLKKRDVSGLTYARNRMYDPGTGRFTQEDPIGLAGGLNGYGFASGDPVNYGDPFGLEACTEKEVRSGKETAAGKGGPICVERRKHEAQERARICAADQLDLGREASYVGALPVDKRVAGYIAPAGAYENSNLISAYGRKLNPGLKIPLLVRPLAKRVTGASSLFSVLGRLNLAAAAAFGVYDAVSIAACSFKEQ